MGLSACGGGGGPPASGGAGTGGNGTGGTTPTGPSIRYSTTSFHFQADKPYSTPPASVPILATVTGVTSGTLYITVVENNPDVVTVQNITVTSTTSGQATVVPGSPAFLMAGNHQGTFVVRACLNDPTCSTGQLNGSPQTFTVQYDIGSNIDADTVTPRVVPANAAGSITLRRVSVSGTGYADVTTAADRGYIVFTAQGLLKADVAILLRVCDSARTSAEGRVIAVNAAGKISLENAHASCL